MEKQRQELMRQFDDMVKDMSQEEYKDFLENIISDLESRLDCVNEELEDY